MGRFYRTASAMPLDYMYSLNVPLMERVTTANDQYITEELEQSAKLENIAGAFPYLPHTPEEQRAKAITEGYTKQIDDITDEIRRDPANWRSKTQDIDRVSRDLQTNYKVGEISKIVGNYNKYKTVSDTIDKQVEEYGKTGKGISADRAKAYKNHFLSEFIRKNPEGTAYDPKTGEYNAMEAFDPMANIDIRKRLSEELDKMKEDGEIRITDNVTGSGEYFNKETKKWEGISKDKILGIVSGRLNDPQLMDYFRQDTKVGLINGIFDDDPNSPNYGKFIDPYAYNKVPINSSEQSVIDATKKQISGTKNANAKKELQAQLDNYIENLDKRTKLDWNPNSYLAPIMRSVVDQYSNSKTSEENDLSANPNWGIRFRESQANWRHTDDRKFREGMQQKLFEHQDMEYRRKLLDDRINKFMDWGAQKELERIKNEGKKTKGGAKKAGTTSASATVPGTNISSGFTSGTTNVAELNEPKTENKVIGQLYTSPFAYTTEKKDKLTTSLNDEIGLHQHKIEELDTTLNDLLQNHPDDKILISNTQNQISNNKAHLASLESHRENAIQYGLEKWKEKGSDADTTYDPYYEKNVRGYLSGTLKKEYDAASTEFKKIEALRQTKGTTGVPEYADNNQWMKTTYYPALNKKKRAENMYVGTQNVFNEELKDYTDDKLERAANETTNSATIVQTTDNQDKTIISMITASPSNYKIIDTKGKFIGLSFDQGTAVTTPDKFKILGVGATTGLGDKGVEIRAKINGKDVVIIPKDDDGRLNEFMGTEFKKSTDKGIANLGRIITSPTAATIADMVTEMQMNTSSPYGTRDSWTYRVIPNPANISETIEVRARSISTGQGRPKWEVQFKTSDSKRIMEHGSKKGGEYSLDQDRKMTGYIPLSSNARPDGIYHNLEDILAIFPADQ